MHLSIYTEYEKISSSTIRSSSTPSAPASAFFQPRQTPRNAPSSSKYRELLLSFIVSNNLPLRLIESHSFRQLVHHLNPAVLTVSRTTVGRDLYRLFCYHKAQLQVELQQYIIGGGWLSITTDTWSARNYSEYAAVIVHWINNNWEMRNTILDVIYLQEPIHSGEYLAEQMINMTDDYCIIPAIFTVTRDNASTNTIMLLEYKKLALAQPITLKQPWAYTAKAGDICCIGHIINIAVQAALASLKATPDERVEAYRLEIGAVWIPTVTENEIITILTKLRCHIYIFRNRCRWKDALKNQCKAASIKVRQLTLDMPVR